ncbi:oligosaccharide flippase family protein [Halobacterium sp. R2-5]|uniref:oligosaccharide flippase family protein n=1 Tax=Halobacterium sp. R2-5 TaxID=2715751 RepID=UPI0014222364|nr:oligosaccharide flippase family protein [Halobacterium sp. R2-5]NIB99456.1 oligosaccharide flippase family protein [Halobacterium sp. R2-5]
MSAGNLSLGLEAAKAFSANLIQAIVGFAGTVIFARVLGPTSFGGYYFLLSIIFLINRPIWGFGSAAKKRFSEKNAPRGEIVSAITVINFILIAITGTVLLLTNTIKSQSNVPSAELVFLTILGSIIFFFPFQMLIGAKGMPGRSTWLDTLRSVLTLPLQLLFVISGFGAAGMGYGLASATLLTIPVTYYTVGTKPTLPTRETFASLWEFARYSIPGAFVGKAYDRFDILLLGTILTTGVAGHYEVANKLTVPALFLSGAITSGLMPKVSNLQSKSEDPTTDISNALSFASLLAIPIFFGSLALSQKLVVTAYGADYAMAAPYLVGLAFYKVISSQTSVHRSTLSGLDLPRINLKFSTLALLVNVVLGVALVFVIGGIGVVIATIIAEAVQYFGAMYTVKRELPAVEIFPTTFLQQVGAGVAMLFALYGLRGLFVLDSLYSVGLIVGCGAAVYGTVLLVVSPQLRVTLMGVYGDVAGK